ncbi:ribonuclease H-like domain-containing protein [Tanacetum coccineum]
MFAAIETRFGESLDSIFNRLQKIVSRLAILGVDLEQIHEDDLEAMDLKWKLSLLSVRAKKYYQRTGKKIFINANDIVGAPKARKVSFKEQDNTRKHGNNKDKSSKEMLAIDCVGFDWSDMAEEQVQTNIDLMAFSDSEFKDPEFKGYGPKDSEQESNVVCDKKLDNSKENYVETLVEEQVSQDKSSFIETSPNVDKEIVFLVNKMVEFTKPKKHEKPVKKSVRYFHQKVNTIRPRVVNTARPNTAPVNTVRVKRVNAIKSSAYWVWRPTKPNGASLAFKRHNYIVARGRSKTPQQNGVAERRNRTLNEAARTMLAYSKLPTTFWAEAVSTACYVQNKKENLHIGFSENKPIIEGNGPKWLFDIDSLTQSMNYVPVTASTISNNSAGTSEENSQDCIVMPIWKDTSYFDSPTKDVENGEPKTADDPQKQVEDGPNSENVEQERFLDDSSTKDVNAVGKHVNTASPDVTTGSLKLNVVGPSVNTASTNEQESTEEEPELEVL